MSSPIDVMSTVRPCSFNELKMSSARSKLYLPTEVDELVKMRMDRRQIGDKLSATTNQTSLLTLTLPNSPLTHLLQNHSDVRSSLLQMRRHRPHHKPPSNIVRQTLACSKGRYKA